MRIPRPIPLVYNVWRSATIPDELWDRGLLDNPQFHIAVAPVIDGIMFFF
jgi:hypothetical protein